MDLTVGKIPYNLMSTILAFIEIDYIIYKRDIKNKLKNNVKKK
jgi:hypothetical protein